MKTQITDIDTLKDFIGGIMPKADHHATNVNEIILPLVSAIILHKDSEPIITNGKNLLWVKMSSGHTYVFAYSHQTQEIEIRDRTTHGATMHSISNKTPIAQIRSIIQSL